jgi:uncharacterized protein (DUF2252 family)
MGYDLASVGASVGLTRDERRRAGKELRDRVPRSAHAEWEPAPDRPDPVDVLIASGKGRQEHLLPIRYARMAASAFAFLRGAAAVMAVDLAHTPVTGLTAQLCGDAHLLNFGVFASPERNLLFDVNDFDESVPGPWEWDIKRLAASVLVAAREMGIDDADGTTAVAAAVRSYRERMAAFGEMRHLEVFYDRIDADAVLADLSKATRPLVEKAFAKARTRTGERALGRLVEFTDGRHRFKVSPPLTTPLDDSDLERALSQLVREYQGGLHEDRQLLLGRYSLVDVAHKVVGVGSVGRRCYVALLLGSDTDDPIFLQIKEACPSALEPYVGATPLPSEAHRIVAGQRIMQAASDPFLGTACLGGSTYYYVRQLRDMKGSVDVESMGSAELGEYAALCGRVLARAHARGGAPSRMAGYLGKGSAFDDALVSFAQRYADQNAADHAALVQAIEAGRVPAAPPVF